VPARRCIEEYGGGADRAQAELERARAPLPGTDGLSEAEKRTIFARGLLNDVATCAWIAGRSAQRLGRMEEARSAYQRAARYTYARCWDPRRGAFWSPAEAASDSLVDVGSTKP